MPVDASIPLQVQRPRLMGGGEVLALRDLSQRYQMNQIELSNARREQADQIKLRELFSGQGSFDPTGNPTQQTISGAMGISPKAGMALAGQAQANQMRLSQIGANNAQMDVRNLEVQKRKSEILDSIKEKAVAAYDLALKGGSEESAKKAYEETFRNSVRELDESGSLSFVSDEEKQKMLNNVLPIEYARAATTKLSDLTKQAQHREEFDIRMQETEEARRQRASDAAAQRDLIRSEHEAKRAEREDVKEFKREQQRIQEGGSLTALDSSMDRLASSANQVMNHPGLKGITGIRGAFPNIPGSQAADAEGLLNKLKSQVAFDVLQEMRNNSKTGGALGSVSDAEGKRLEANLASLEKAQSFEQFQKELKAIIAFTREAKSRMRRVYGEKWGEYGGAEPAAPAKAGALPWPKDLNTLEEGKIYQTPNGPGKYLGKGANGKLRFEK